MDAFSGLRWHSVRLTPNARVTGRASQGLLRPQWNLAAWRPERRSTDLPGTSSAPLACGGVPMLITESEEQSHGPPHGNGGFLIIHADEPCLCLMVARLVLQSPSLTSLQEKRGQKEPAGVVL